MSGFLHELIPGLAPLHVLSDACATCNTPGRRPYIGPVGPNLFVATGGNGFAAKSSDEIGRLGAVCALATDGEWEGDTELPSTLFKPLVLPARALS
jgi:sarcosine oxidase / L-pipecolate oxidase